MTHNNQSLLYVPILETSATALRGAAGGSGIGSGVTVVVIVVIKIAAVVVVS